MLVREVMTRPVIAIRRTESVREAIRRLEAHDITAAPVVDEAGHMVGIVSEMDLLRGEFELDPPLTCARSPWRADRRHAGSRRS
jgi:CBS domain-containing protein